MAKSLPKAFYRRAEKLIEFCRKNEWQVSPGRGSHVRLTHPRFGLYFTASTPSDWRGPMNTVTDLKNIMRRKGGTPK